jgi:hypothetical protein
MVPGEPAAALLAAIDAEQARLRELVAGVEATKLAGRPPNGRWSVVENVRHLLFAEQLHVGRFLPAGPPLHPLGLPPDGMRKQERFRALDFAANPGVTEVLDAWEAVHASTRGLLGHDTDQVRKALAGNLRHLRTHITVIERLLRARR